MFYRGAIICLFQVVSGLLLSVTVLAVELVKIEPLDINKIPDSFFTADLLPAKKIMSQGKWDKALVPIERHIKNPPLRSTIHKAYLLKGVCLQGLGKDPEAIVAFDKFLSLYAANSDVLYLKSQSVGRLGDAAKAVALLEEALWFGKINLVTVPQINYQMALFYVALNDQAKALEKLNAVNAADGNFVPAIIELGNLYLKSNDKVNAVKYLRSARALQPNDVELQAKLARALLIRSDRTSGQKDIEEARMLSKQLYDSKNLSEKLRSESAEIYVRANIEEQNFEEAHKMLALLIKNDPKNSEFQHLRQQIKVEKQSALENIATGIPK